MRIGLEIRIHLNRGQYHGLHPFDTTNRKLKTHPFSTTNKPNVARFQDQQWDLLLQCVLVGYVITADDPYGARERKLLLLPIVHNILSVFR